MNLNHYLHLKAQRKIDEKAPRERCFTCKLPFTICYCRLVKPFTAPALFVILIHRNESRRSVATGRMAHLCIKNSRLFEGTNFTHHEGVNEILANPKFHPVVLYPGQGSVDVTEGINSPALIDPTKQLVVFLIDGTWSHARRIWRLSRNLHRLGQVRFTPTTPSRFKVRRQPRSYCYSTIEAIHFMIDRLPAANLESRPHQNLIEVFDFLVARQVRYAQDFGPTRGFRAVRGLRSGC
jgi:DTW domain-containing protein YfiP